MRPTPQVFIAIAPPPLRSTYLGFGRPSPNVYRELCAHALRMDMINYPAVRAFHRVVAPKLGDNAQCRSAAEMVAERFSMTVQFLIDQNWAALHIYGRIYAASRIDNIIRSKKI